MKLLLSLVLLIVSSFAYSVTPGFGTLEELTYSTLSGRLSVTCSSPNGTDHAFHNCRARDIDPGTHAYFYGPEGVVANKIKLISTWESGKVVKKTKSYDAKKFRSKRVINLAIGSLLQRPLLGYGKNVINYSLLKNDEVVYEGSFEINFTKVESRRCRDGHIFSHNEDDCRVGSNICREYFRRQNYCM